MKKLNFLSLFRKPRSRPETTFSEEAEACLRTWRIYAIANDVLNQKVVVRQPAFPVTIEFFNDPKWAAPQKFNALRDAKVATTWQAIIGRIWWV